MFCRDRAFSVQRSTVADVLSSRRLTRSRPTALPEQTFIRDPKLLHRCLERIHRRLSPYQSGPGLTSSPHTVTYSASAAPAAEPKINHSCARSSHWCHRFVDRISAACRLEEDPKAGAPRSQRRHPRLDDATFDVVYHPAVSYPPTGLNRLSPRSPKASTTSTSGFRMISTVTSLPATTAVRSIACHPLRQVSIFNSSIQKST